MTNAKDELLRELEDIDKELSDIIAISISRGYYESNTVIRTESIKDLGILDFEYNSGYGGQELYGTVLFNDYTWLDRGEYDGSEWWEYHKPPTVEEVLNETE